MQLNWINVLIALLPSIIYAFGGLIAAVKAGEKVSWPTFLKTIIVGGVTSGLITQQTADLLLAIASTTTITYVLDKLLNAVVRK